MRNYIEFAKNYLEERDYKVLAIEDNCLIFDYEKILFLFALKDSFPYSLPVMKTTKKIRKFPHFIEGENLTSLCLGYEEDFNLYENSPEEIILETFERFFSLLTLSPSQQNKEFSKEFLYFWHKDTPSNGNFKLYIKPKQHAEEIFIEETFKKHSKNKGNRKIARTKLRLAYTKETFINDSHFKSGTKIKGIYIPLIDIKNLSPFPENWDIREILNYNISSKSYDYLRNYNVDKNEIWIIFSMDLENEFKIMFAAKFKFVSKKKENIVDKLNSELKEVIPYYSKRYDVDYLCQRTSGNLNNIGKKISLIGCGSLGSYIATEICKLGIANLELFDSDLLTPENIFRHTLGLNYSFINKAGGLKIKLENDYPQLKVTDNNYNINHNNFFDQNFSDSDLLIFAIGKTTTQLVINDLLAKNKFDKPVLYTWLDSFGSGCHALLVDYSKKGCYKCLSLDEVGKFSKESKITFSKFSEDVIYGDGCGGTFTPYGSTILLKGTSMIIKIISDYFEGKNYEKNPLFSIKNYYQDNIEYTDRFLKKESELLENYDFIVERCDSCGR